MMLSFPEFTKKTAELLKLADQTGGPLYVYSLATIQNRISALQNALPKDVQVFYSLKANSHPTIVETIHKTGLFADVASKGELEVALKAGFSAAAIEFTGPGKTMAEISTAIEAGVGSLVVESVQELLAIETRCTELGKKISVQVRLNPLRKLNSSGRTIDLEASHFGIDEEDTADLSNVLKKCSHVSVSGTHSHSQSQFLSVDHAIENFSYALEAASRFSIATGTKLRFVNLGGGLGIPYADSQTPIDVQQFATAFTAFIEKARVRPEFTGVQFRLEFGRFIVGEAGAFITRVLYTKTSRGKKIAITDGGFTQSQIACGIGQLVRRNLPIRVISATQQSKKETITIAGPSCYGLDILANDVELPTLAPGDIICIHGVGAYGYSFSPVGFIRHQTAQEHFI